MQGDAAQSFLNRLHDKKVVPKRSLMGQFASATSKATLYVSVFKVPHEAVDAVKRMSSNIRGGNPIFRHHAEFTVHSLDVERCVGLEQVHFYFLHRAKVYWLATDPLTSSEVFDALVRSVLGSDLSR